MSNRNLFKIAGFVGIITIISKTFGLIRDLVIAKFFGTSIVADAYNFAYLLTGNFLILLGGLGGPFHSATVASLSKIKDNSKETGSFLIKIILVTFVVLSLIAFLIFKFKHLIFPVLIPASGLDPAYKEKLWYITGIHLDIMLPLIVISGLLGILCGVSNIYKNFFSPSFGPALPSISIVLLIFLYPENKLGLSLAIGTLIGAILQLFIQVPDLIKGALYENIKFSFVKNQKTVSEFGFFLGPALLSTTIGQLTVYVDSFFCSGLEEGSWTATVFANRLIQLPLGVLATSFLVPFFPRFSELANNKDIKGLKNTSLTVIKTLWFLITPMAVYLLLFNKEIIELLFQRGAFDERSTELTAGILSALSLSMIAYVARDTLTRVFYSLGDSRTPLIIAIISILLKMVFNSLLVAKYHAAGIAFATSLVTCLNFLLLAILLRKQIGSLGWIKNIRSLSKLIIVTLTMYMFVLLFLNIFPLSTSDNLFSKLTLISISFTVCCLIYFGLALTLRIEEAEKIFLEMKRKINI